MDIKIVNTSKHPLPAYQTIGSAGMDLHAALETPLSIEPGEARLVKTGIHLQLPQGVEAQLRPRSGLALKYSVTVLNTPATIDSDYRGEIMVLLINHGSEVFLVNDGDRVCQMVIAKHETVRWQPVDELKEDTARGAQGFGHTGK